MTVQALFCSAVAVTIIGQASFAADLHVPSRFANIQAAIDAANPGDVVMVADGVYTGAGNRDLSFHGKAITVRSANGPDACTIDCQGTPEVPYRGFCFSSGEGPDSMLMGFTITNGATLPGAIADQFNGAAILCNNNSSPTIMNCVLTNNHAGCWGGAVCCTNASPTLVNCTITDNFVGDDGGGVFVWAGGQVTIIDSIIARNTAVSTGGGFTNFGSTATLINVTIVGNTSWFGGGAYAWNTTMTNSIVWGNESLGGSEQVVDTGNTLVEYSNIEGGFAGIGNINVDPRFVDPANGDFHLRHDSPSLDAGDPDFEPAPGQTDIDGHARLMGMRIDMGADERHSPDLTGDGNVNSADLALLLGSWGPCSGCATDLNDDGTVNGADLAILLGNWG